MKLSTKKLCSILGIQSKALRLYEEKGLLKPKRNPQNDYREYNMEDIYTYLQIKKYQAQGSSLQEVYEHIHRESFADTQGKLQEQIDYLEDQIRQLTWQKEHLQAVHAMHHENYEQAFTVIEHNQEAVPAYECILCSELEEMQTAKPAAAAGSEWSKYFSHLNILIIQHLDHPLADGHYACSIGITTIDPDTASYLSRTMEVKKVCGTEQFNYPIITETPLHLTYEDLHTLFDYCRTNNLQMPTELHMYYNTSFHAEGRTRYMFSGTILSPSGTGLLL